MCFPPSQTRPFFPLGQSIRIHAFFCYFLFLLLLLLVVISSTSNLKRKTACFYLLVSVIIVRVNQTLEFAAILSEQKQLKKNLFLHYATPKHMTANRLSTHLAKITNPFIYPLSTTRASLSYGKLSTVTIVMKLKR